jgi:hypothetical protein
MSGPPQQRWKRLLGRLSGGPRWGLSGGVWVALAALLLALGVAYVRHPEGRFTRAGRAHGDGVYYYVYLRSLVYDRDLDFENDYALLGNPHHRPVGEHGLRENRFAIGAGLLWLPTFAVGSAATAGSNALGWTDEPQDGTGTQTQRITLFASVLHAWLTALLITLLARRYVAAWIACAAGIATVMATPLWWYAVYQPSWPHAASACVVALFVLVWERGREDRSARGWLGLGGLLGLVALVRAQDVVFAALPAGSLLWALWRGPNAARRQALRDGLLFAAGALLAFSPQMLAWWQIYGSPLTIPQGDGFMQWSASKPGFTLFSSRNGLLSWSPIVSVSLVGMLMLALRRGAGRGLAIGLLLVFAAEAFILGSTRDWWAGWAFGGRRYLGCCVIFGLGLAVVIDRVHGWTTRHSRLVLASLPVGAIGLFVVCNLSLTHDYLFAEVKRGEGQAMRPVYERAALRGVGAVFDTIGNPGAAPASWWFAWRAGVGAERYDAASGIELTEPTGRTNEQFVVWLDDPRIGMAGFSARDEHAGQRASLVAETGTFVLPMRRSVGLQARVKLAAVEAASLEIEVEGVRVFAAEVVPGWHSYDFEIPAEALGPGFNFAAVTQSGPIAWGSLQLWRARRPFERGALDARPLAP